MTFLEQRLDTRIERGARGGPVNRGRSKVYTSSGKLRQVFGWSAPLQEWDVSHGLKSRADFDLLRSMWYVVNFTPYEGFRFRDWSDFTADQTNTTLTLISGATYQLQRTYTFAAIVFKRDIKKPCAAPAPVVYRTRASVVTTASASVDTTTGIATIGGHVVGDTYTWAGNFDVPVTFAENELPAELESGPGEPYLISQAIKIEEVRL